MNYLKLNVLTDKTIPDCSNNGVSVNGSVLLFPVASGNIKSKDIVEMELHDINVVVLEERPLPFIEASVAFRAKGSKQKVMFGGNYVTSSDSRFKKLYPYPIPVHDRIEG